MDAISAVADRSERPAYVRFERRPVEDKQASLSEGRFVAKDVDFALVTPPYSKDAVEYKVETWLRNLEQNVRNERVSPKFRDHYLDVYKAWQNGQELPLHGTPIKGWGVISPSQQEMLIKVNILTVEDLAAINDDGKRRIGMGALDLKTKANAWLSQLSDKGPLTQEMAALKKENEILKGSLKTLTEQVDRLSRNSSNNVVEMPSVEITASDLIEEPIQKGPDIPAYSREGIVEAYTAKFGKKPHHKMKDETIMEALK